LAKNYKNDSIVPVDVDKVGVVAAYYDPLCVYVCVCVCVCVCVYFTTWEGTSYTVKFTQIGQKFI